VETGAKKLAQLYTKTVAEGSSGPLPPPGTEADSQLPPEILSALLPLVAILRTLPLPSTHPSHPASPAILSALKDAQRGYSDMRGTWGRKCLDGRGKKVIDRAATIDGVVAGREFGNWVKDLLNVAEVVFFSLASRRTEYFHAYRLNMIS
jgi:exocyst complex component 7